MTRRAPAFWSVVFVLLKAAHKRASGRLRRLMQLDRHRDGRARRSWRVLVFGLVCLIATMPHLGTAIDIGISIPTAEQVQAEQSGRVVAEEWFVGRTEIRLSEAARSPTRRAQIMQEEDADIAIEAQRLADRDGGDATAIAALLRQTVGQNPKALLAKSSLWWQPGNLPDIFALFAVTAEAGNARAALLLGETYDGCLIRRLNCSADADPATARTWYEVAAEFGSTDARQRLDRLARHQPEGDLPSRR